MNSQSPSIQSAPALKAAISLSAGILLSRTFHIPFPVIWTLSLCLSVFSLTSFGFTRDRLTSSILILLALAGLGWARAIQTIQYLPRDHIALQKIGDQIVQLSGWIRRDPIRRSYRTEYFIEVTTLQIDDTLMTVRGNLLVLDNTETSMNLGYGDGILVTGRLDRPRGRRNPGGFDYRAYLARSRTYLILRMDRHNRIQSTGETHGNPLLRRVVYPCRHAFSKTITRVTTPQNCALLHALILGDRNSVTPEIKESFSHAGVIHILAVSGLHVGFVLMNLMTLFGLFRLPYSLRVCLTLCFLAGFVLLTEAKPPVCRAALMGGLYLVGKIIERRTNGLNLIGIAGLCLLIPYPQHLFDPGFQLSFLGVLSILFFLPKLESVPIILRIRHRLKNHKIVNSALTLTLVSLSAQVGTLPLTVYHFGRIPLLSIPINGVIIPLTALIVPLGWITAVTGLFLPGVATIYGALTDLLLDLLALIVTAVGSLSFSAIKPPRPDLPVVLVYFTAITLLVTQHNRHRIRLCFTLLIGLNLFVWKHALDSDGRAMEWVQFDVGQGDAALIRMPRHRTILIDGGIRSPFIDYGQRVILPFLQRQGITHLDAVILTHPHSDHVGGLVSVIQNIRVNALFLAGTPYPSRLYSDFLESARNRSIPIHYITAPCCIEGFPGSRVSVLSPTHQRQGNFDRGEENDQSLVILAEFGKNRLLFMGDAEKPVEHELIKRYPHFSIDALKVGHHGSFSSSSESFLREISPSIAVISVGDKNRFGHPSSRVMSRLHHLGCRVYRTDREGAMVLRCDGNRLEVVDWR